MRTLDQLLDHQSKLIVAYGMFSETSNESKQIMRELLKVRKQILRRNNVKFRTNADVLEGIQDRL